MSDGKIFALGVGAIIAGIFVIIGLASAVQYVYERNLQCPSFGASVERPYKYDWFAGGCFVQTSTGQWVAEKNYWNNPVLSGK